MAALAYLASYGARTPMLAVRGLLRLRNLAVILGPAALLFALAHVEIGNPTVRSGLAALVSSPAPLAAPELLLRTGRRGDLAGAYVLGSVLLSIVLVNARPVVPQPGLIIAIQAYLFASFFANAIPLMRDFVLVPLRIIGWAGAAVVLASAFVLAPIDATSIIAAVALLVAGAAAAAIVARIAERDAVASIAGAGLRDPVIAVAICLASDPAAAAVPLVYAVFCLGLVGALLRAR